MIILSMNDKLKLLLVISLILTSCSTVGSKVARELSSSYSFTRKGEYSLNDYLLDRQDRHITHEKRCVEEFTHIEDYIVDDSQLNLMNNENVTATLKFTPTVFYFEKSAWSRAAIVRELRKTSKILYQCGILIKRARLIKLTSPTGYPDFFLKNKLINSYEKRMFGPRQECTKSNEDTAKLLDANMKPAIFLVRDLYYTDGIAYGGSPGNEKYWGPSLSGTIWIGDESLIIKPSIDKEDDRYRDPSYSLMAHEVGHLLSLQHDDQREGNIMTMPYRRGKGIFNPEPYMGRDQKLSQCERIQKSKYLEEI